MRSGRRRRWPASVALALLLAACGATSGPRSAADVEPAAAFIVQGTDVAVVAALVREVGGVVTHELGIINAVGARLTPSQRAALELRDGVTRIHVDRTVSVEGAGNDTRSGPLDRASPGQRRRQVEPR